MKLKERIKDILKSDLKGIKKGFKALAIGLVVLLGVNVLGALSMDTSMTEEEEKAYEQMQMQDVEEQAQEEENGSFEDYLNGFVGRPKEDLINDLSTVWEKTNNRANPSNEYSWEVWSDPNGNEITIKYKIDKNIIEEVKVSEVK